MGQKRHYSSERAATCVPSTSKARRERAFNTATAEHAIAAYKRSYPSLFGLIIEADLSPIFWFSISNSFVVYLRHNRDGTHTHPTSRTLDKTQSVR
jgi:hypothetical protein